MSPRSRSTTPERHKAPGASGRKRPKPPAPSSRPDPNLPQRKLIAFEPDTLRTLEVLARDRMQDFQELADEAFRDLLKKHGRPVMLKDALKQSARIPANDDA